MDIVKRVIKKALIKSKISILNYGKVNYKNQGIINLIDIGSKGKLPDPWFKNAKYIKTLLKFEPQDKNSKKENIIQLEVALWNEIADLPFYIYKGFSSSGSSLFQQNFEYVENNFDKLKKIGPKHLANTWHERSKLIKTEKIHCSTLDHELAKFKDCRFDFLKVDAQGAEYQILNGASNFLKKDCLGLQLELFNKPMYKGIKLASEVISFLKDKGFYVYRKFPYHGTFNSQNDYIFLKEEKKILNHKAKILRILKEIYS